MEKILEMALSRVEEAELYRARKEVTLVKFQANRIKSIDSLFGDGVGLRVIHREKIGFSSTSRLENPHSLVNRALVSSQFGQKAYFHFPSSVRVCPVQCFDPEVSSLKVDKMVEEGERAISLITKEEPQFSCEGELEKAEIEVRILNSNGLNESYKRTEYAFFVYAFLAKEGDFLGVEEGESGCSYKDHSFSIARRILKAINLAGNNVKISHGSYPVVFTSRAVPLLLQSLKSGINGKLVQKRSSPLTGKMGKPIVSSAINIFDDGLFPFGIGSRPVDGEGMPSRRTQIIQDGVLKSFIYDLQTAGVMKTESTANALRSYNSLPSPSTTNLVLEPGDVSFEEMVKDIKDGIIVDQVIGSGQGNELTGEFSVNVDLGYRVKRGEIKGRLKDVMISGNAYKLLNQVIGVGKEARFVGAIRTPPLYFEKVTVTG